MVSHLDVKKQNCEFSIDSGDDGVKTFVVCFATVGSILGFPSKRIKINKKTPDCKGI